MQYFRLPLASWRDRLEKAKAGGLNTVSSYMPWYWHEPQEGLVDFTGKTLPERNLRHYLELAAEIGLYVIARPGPFVNSELRCGGTPEWLFKNYPETLSRRGDGAVCTGRPVPAEGEPLYRNYVKGWYSRVVPLLAEYDINRGGPVILFQPDNELSAAWSYGLLNSLFDPTVLGETWPAWLKRRYAEIGKLNGCYGAEHKNFKSVKPPRSLPASRGDWQICRDWMDFKRWFFADWGATMAGWAREFGMQVPMVFNEPVAGYYGHGDHAGFGALLKERGIEGCTACHSYSDRILDLDGIINISQGIEMVKSSPWGGPPMSVEVNTCWFIPRLSRSEIMWEPLMLLGLGRGLMGTVIYPYTAGTSPLIDTIEGPEYFDPSCIDREGNLSEGYRRLKCFNAFVRGWEADLVQANTPAEVTVAYTPGQRLLDFLGAPALLGKVDRKSLGVAGGERFDAEPALGGGEITTGHDWLDGYEGVDKQTVAAEEGIWKRNKEASLLLNRLNVGWDMLDLTNPNKKPGKGWLIVPCTGALETEAIDYIIEHLDTGGGCLFFPTIPVFGLDGKPDARLADRLGVNLRAQVRPAGAELVDYGTRVIRFSRGEECGLNCWIYRHEYPAGSRVLAEYDGQPVAALLSSERGRVIVAGFDAVFTSAGSLRLWRSLIEGAMGICPAVRIEGNWLHALWREGSGASFLTLMNVTGRYGASRVYLPRPVGGVADISFDIELKPHTARCLVMGAELNDGMRLVFSTSELVPLNMERTVFDLYGCPGTPGIMAFNCPVSAALDGKAVMAEERNGLFVIKHTHAPQPLRLDLRASLSL
ncbi:MAG: beta-galactosidase [Verrucomicrobia bacterium]|nr:beta-galactosidase [Verrucomicrobiota bacterium]